MLKMVQQCTNEKGKELNEQFHLTIEDIEGFIGLVYMRGGLLLRKANVHDIFSTYLGCPFLAIPCQDENFVQL
jgi:hypothetical protein